MEVGYREAVLPDLCPQSKEKPWLVGGRGGQSTHDFRKGEALGLSCLLLCSPGMSCPFSSSEAGVTLHIKWQARRWAAREVPEPGMGNWHCPARSAAPSGAVTPGSVLLCHGPTGSAFRTWPGPKRASKETAI